MEFLEIMQKLNACHGPSGDEGQVAAAIREMAQPYVDEITTDVLGNLICHKKGSGPKVMFAAHMDSIGFIITHIDDNGYLRFGQVGGLSAHDLPGTPVRFRNGTRGVVAVQGKVEPKDWKLDHLYIDIGAKDRAEASTMVQVGDMSVFDTVPFVSGGKLFSPYLDDRIACAICSPLWSASSAATTTCTSYSPSRRRWACGAPAPPPTASTPTTASPWT